jgi:uncharacterized SAM-binding protein YcdF (DUF218 family)
MNESRQPDGALNLKSFLLTLAGWVFVTLAGWVFVAQIVIGFTGLPHELTSWLAGNDFRSDGAPRYVVVLGGGGIPSETGLIRTYHAAAFDVAHTGLTHIVALPSDGDPTTNSVGRMRDELVMRGIPAASIRMEYRGRDTHEQAANVRTLLGPDALNQSVIVVTSPYHLRRALLCFRKEGFRRVSGLPAQSIGAEADLGPGVAWRYVFWSNLENTIAAARELLALLQYGLKGWI